MADEIKFEETKNDESRTLSFSISAGTEEIEIIGTILANNSFLIEQEQQAENSAAQAQQADADAAAQAEQTQADAEAAAQADAAEQQHKHKQTQMQKTLKKKNLKN